VQTEGPLTAFARHAIRDTLWLADDRQPCLSTISMSDLANENICATVNDTGPTSDNDLPEWSGIGIHSDRYLVGNNHSHKTEERPDEHSERTVWTIQNGMRCIDWIHETWVFHEIRRMERKGMRTRIVMDCFVLLYFESTCIPVFDIMSQSSCVYNRIMETRKKKSLDVTIFTNRRGLFEIKQSNFDWVNV
jgi:hypothetical protein